eukprot:CAMPEP_0178771454 /NCGR_PEP_ID=MMETSP0744-20121128/21963_1 /TAXON_ID=913974 /ORGANISM="Nitzschia punctata, Strain CCMP561" /LENGTH=93 /DNA_ID=CAMNT_0020427957 /DNA_START=611 /DNA_END=888 /DNA_ORIENTATION=+
MVPEGPIQQEVALISFSSFDRFSSSSTTLIHGRLVFSVTADAGAVPTFRSRIVHELIWPSRGGPPSGVTTGESLGVLLINSAERQGISPSIFA